MPPPRDPENTSAADVFADEGMIRTGQDIYRTCCFVDLAHGQVPNPRNMASDGLPLRPEAKTGRFEVPNNWISFRAMRAAPILVGIHSRMAAAYIAARRDSVDAWGFKACWPLSRSDLWKGAKSAMDGIFENCYKSGQRAC